MYYILSLILFIVLYFVFVKVLSSMVKGCFTALLVVIVIVAVSVMIRSTKEPVNLLGLFVVDNFEITKLK